jgi:hypothetical protein
MEEDHDDFTFPTTVAAVRVPGSASAPPVGASSSRLWPFAAAVKKEEDAEAPAAASTRREQAERATVVDDEDRMDMLWDDTAAAAPASAKSGARAKPERPDAPEVQQERMDLLWESFNEELLLLRQRACSSSNNGKRNNGPEAEPDELFLCPSSTSGAESEEDASAVSSPGRARYGCAPTMLRASSRAGQFYVTPRRRRSRGGGGWTLLLRLFRRLFAVDDKADPRRHDAHVPSRYVLDQDLLPHGDSY